MIDSVFNFKSVIVSIFLFMFSMEVYPWNPFGPKNYDDCILENMKGVNNAYAAASVRNACRAKFPAIEDSSKNQIRSGYPRINIWDTPYNSTLFDKIEIINGVGDEYRFNLTITNTSSIDLTSVYIGIPRVRTGKCERAENFYQQIYQCEGKASSSTTSNFYCTKFTGSYCLVGFTGTFQSDLDNYFRRLGY